MLAVLLTLMLVSLALLLVLPADKSDVQLGLGILIGVAVAGLAALAWTPVQDRTRYAQLAVVLAAQHDEASEAAIGVDRHGCVFYLNAAAERLLGLASVNALGVFARTLLPLFSSTGDALDPFAIEEISVKRAVHDFPFLRIDRRPLLPVSLFSLPLCFQNGSIAGALLRIRDARQLQRETDQASQSLQYIGATVDAVVGIAAGETIGSWNDGACRLFGYDVEEVEGVSISLLVGAERKTSLEQAVRAALSGERLLDRDLTVRARDGREVDVSLAAFPLPAAMSGGARAVMVLRDIGARRAGERRIRHLGSQLVRRAQELQAIFDIAPVGMAIADSPDCLHIRPNVALANVLGLERTAEITFTGDAAYSLWRDKKLLREQESPLHCAVAQRAVIEPMELEIRTADRVVTVMAYGAPVIDQESAVVGAIAVFVDISAMKQVHAERQRLLAEAIAARRLAEEASRLKEEFLATVSHELRTPLNAMHGWLEIMQRKPDAATQARGLDVIRRNVKAQTRVIEDILDVSAFVTGKARLMVRSIDLLDVVRATIESLRPTADAKAVRLVMDEAPEQSAAVNGDPERLQQVMWNLLSNAVKFTASGGLVRVSVRHTASHLEVQVSDSGEGIDAAFLPYVFDRFRQADSSIERRHSGLGLGLAIVRHLIELHGGSVDVSSPGLGRGATFCVRLPLPPIVPHTDNHSSEHDELAGRHAERQDEAKKFGRLLDEDILLVEDDISAAEILAHALRDDGARVHVAHSASDGLALLEGQPVAAIVSDIGMPHRDGYAFIDDVRMAERRAGHSPVLAIAVTAYARSEDRDRALAAGFDAYLVKPITPSQLSDLIAERLAERISPLDVAERAERDPRP